MTGATLRRRAPDRRLRAMRTPEGIALPLTIASRSARAGALLLDLVIVAAALVAFVILLLVLGVSISTAELEEASGPVEFLLILLLIIVFLARYGYFLWFELGPRGATPGKRALGIRVAARDGQRLTAEAVIARNLMRDAEVFLPLFFLLGGGASEGVMGTAAFVWLAIFALFPFFNRDALRAGDLIAGTWVVEDARVKLPEAMSLRAQEVADAPADYVFGEAELAVYGEHELQVLERVLREGREQAMRSVMEAICAKIGWQAGTGDEREFLEAFYAALRARLERDMRFGRRKKDKFS